MFVNQPGSTLALCLAFVVGAMVTWEVLLVTGSIHGRFLYVVPEEEHGPAQQRASALLLFFALLPRLGRSSELSILPVA